jgi:hypothetical protein
VVARFDEEEPHWKTSTSIGISLTSDDQGHMTVLIVQSRARFPLRMELV